MNKLQLEVLENLVREKIMEMDYIPTALYNALDSNENRLDDDIMDLLECGAYIVPDEMILTVEDIDTVLEYGMDYELDITLGFGSVLESYVMTELSNILGVDFIELM